MTKDEAKAWAARWRRVNAQEKRQLRRTPAGVKLRQVAELMAWAEAMGWQRQLDAETEEVRRRWRKIRKALAGGD